MVGISRGMLTISSILLLACHKKSYLIYVELTNFRIFLQPIPNFFLKVQNWDNQQRAETAAIANFEISSNLTIPNWLMTYQKHLFNGFLDFLNVELLGNV